MWTCKCIIMARQIATSTAWTMDCDHIASLGAAWPDAEKDCERNMKFFAALLLTDAGDSF